MSTLSQGSASQRGFTLIELMIAMVIGLIIVLAASQVFLASLQSFDRVELLNDRQEKLRFLSDSVSLDVRTSDSNVSTANAGSLLTLQYSGSRSTDPYCSGGNLERLEYQFEAETSTLSMKAYCSGVTPVEEPLISGLEMVNFAEGSINGSVAYIDVIVRFPALDGEASAGREVAFRATNRSAVITQVNASN